MLTFRRFWCNDPYLVWHGPNETPWEARGDGRCLMVHLTISYLPWWPLIRILAWWDSYPLGTWQIPRALLLPFHRSWRRRRTARSPQSPALSMTLHDIPGPLDQGWWLHCRVRWPTFSKATEAKISRFCVGGDLQLWARSIVGSYPGPCHQLGYHHCRRYSRCQSRHLPPPADEEMINACRFHSCRRVCWTIMW